MGTSQHQQLPPDLERGRSRFRTWRGQRKAGDRIPQVLWAMATRLAKAHGVSRTAAALGLDYYGLKKRALALASWCAIGGRLHRIGKRHVAAIRPPGDDLAGLINENTHDEPP